MLNMPGIVNDAFLKHANADDLLARGLTYVNDGTAGWGSSWDMTTRNFELTVDSCFVVKIARRNPDSDYIKVLVEDLSDFDDLLAFIAD